MAQIQIAVRIPGDLLATLDELIADGEFDNRAEAVRLGLTAVVRSARQRRIGGQIADGYRALPQAEDLDEWAAAAAVAMINEEPWT